MVSNLIGKIKMFLNLFLLKKHMFYFLKWSSNSTKANLFGVKKKIKSKTNAYKNNSPFILIFKNARTCNAMFKKNELVDRS
jgi:hypothetical protein